MAYHIMMPWSSNTPVGTKGRVYGLTWNFFPQVTKCLNFLPSVGIQPLVNILGNKLRGLVWGGGTNLSDAGLNLSGSWQQGHSATYNTPSRI